MARPTTRAGVACLVADVLGVLAAIAERGCR
jgi:hypothetical protein